MDGSERHAQAGIWAYRNGTVPSGETAPFGTVAALFMEGEAPDRPHGVAMVVEALYDAVRARGLRVTTDLDHLDLHPVPGSHLFFEPRGGLTLAWPHIHPLLQRAALELPPCWRRRATQLGVVVVFASYGLGLHEHAGDGEAHPGLRLMRLAESGAVAAGAVTASAV